MNMRENSHILFMMQMMVVLFVWELNKGILSANLLFAEKFSRVKIPNRTETLLVKHVRFIELMQIRMMNFHEQFKAFGRLKFHLNFTWFC